MQLLYPIVEGRYSTLLRPSLPSYLVFRITSDSTPWDTLKVEGFKLYATRRNATPTEKMRFGINYADWAWWKTFVLLAFIGAILWLTWWLNKRKLLILKELKGNTNAPYAWSIHVEGADKVALNDAFYTASNQKDKLDKVLKY